MSLTSPKNAHVTLPPDEARKAPYPLGCPVLCLEQDKFHTGHINSVKLSISFSPGGQFDTFYEVAFHQAQRQPQIATKMKIYDASNLRFLAGCPVFLSAEHFQNDGDDRLGFTPGIIIGSFEVPCSQCSSNSLGNPKRRNHHRPKHYYSVRVSLSNGEYDEHGVEKEHITFRSGESDEVVMLRATPDKLGDPHYYKKQTEDAALGWNANAAGEEIDPEVLSNTESRIIGIKRSPFSSQESRPFMNGTNAAGVPTIIEAHSPATKGDSAKREEEQANDGNSDISMIPYETEHEHEDKHEPEYEHEQYPEPECTIREPCTVTKHIQNVPAGNPSPTNYNNISAITDAPAIMQRSRLSTPMPVSKIPLTTKLHQTIREEDRENVFRGQSSSQQDIETRATGIQRTVSAITDTSDALNRENKPPRVQTTFSPEELHEARSSVRGINSRKPASARASVGDLNARIANLEMIANSGDDSDRRKSAPVRMGSQQHLHDIIMGPAVRKPKMGTEQQLTTGKTHVRKEPSRMLMWNDSKEKFTTDQQTNDKDQRLREHESEHSYKPRRGTLPNDGDESSDNSYEPPSETKMMDDSHFKHAANLSPIVAKPSPKLLRGWGTKEDSTSAAEQVTMKDSAPAAGSTTQIDSTAVAGSTTSLRSGALVDSNSKPTVGCYLVYGTESGGRLSLHYSRTVVDGAIGFWSPGDGEKLQGFKFCQNAGRVELIKGIAGSESNKKKFHSGWCQFIKGARAYNGLVCKWPDRAGIEVDLYVFFNETESVIQIKNGEMFDTSQVDAIACVRKNANCYDGVKQIRLGVFLEKATAVGASVDMSVKGN